MNGGKVADDLPTPQPQPHDDTPLPPSVASAAREDPFDPVERVGVILSLVGGLAFLILGAGVLVRGASRLALSLGFSSLVVGLTVVAFGTSAPEAAVSVQAGLLGQGDIALGNVVGSNIFNILFILGISALITPLGVSRRLVRLDVPLMIVASVALIALSWNGRLGRWESLVLFAGIVTYTVLLTRTRTTGERSGESEEGTSVSGGVREVALDLLLVAVGVALLVVGSRWLVEGAIEVARVLGVSELVIGLTVIAVGTSLPEAATSIAASLQGQKDLAVGNVVGSNIFNILFVLGLAGATAPGGIRVSPAVLTFDLPVMAAVAAACLPVFYTGYRVDRWEGALFLLYFVAYMTFLVLDRSDHGAAPIFGGIMAGYVIPITIGALVALGLRQYRLRHGGGRSEGRRDADPPEERS